MEGINHLPLSMSDSTTQTGPSAHDGSNSEKTRSCRSNDLKKIKDQVISECPSNLRAITIVGMGGIGKTTLAKTIYDDIQISYHFHRRGWVTASQDYELKNLFLCLLRSITMVDIDESDLENEALEEMLYKNLKGKKFLIVLDDIWSVEIWNVFKRIFPDDCNGSRVILTSRDTEVVRDVEPNSNPHNMNCLTIEESWRLLHSEVFVGEACPSNLVEIGQKIAKRCQGLPLAIVVVAGHLSKIDKKQDCWADVAKSLDALLMGKEKLISDVLCLSYNFLTHHLKACFLYMGFFPKNSEIPVAKLIRLWNAVGFVQSEYEAEKCLQDLINRNLIGVKKKKYDGTAKTCGIHDLLWDLSLTEAQKEGHFIFSQFNFGHCRYNSTTGDTSRLIMHLTSSYRSLGDSSGANFSLTSVCATHLRILEIPSKVFLVFPEIITNLVGLRYLELSTTHIPGSVSKLCNLETLISRCKGWKDLYLPKEIWLLSHLRHLQVGRVTLVTPVDCNNVLPYDLQTLSTVSFALCAHLDFSRIPNLMQLKIWDINGEEDESLSSFLDNLVYLHRLEKLNLHFRKGIRRRQQIPWCDCFPPNIKQLTLSESHLPWKDMNILAMLPNVEELKLKKNAFKGPIYEQTVEGFQRLKVLLFEDLQLEEWIAETIHYPLLQHLVLRHCKFLQEIPISCFGEMPTLESIELVSCSKSTKKSAEAIKQEQHSLGNDLQVRIYSRRILRFKSCISINVSSSNSSSGPIKINRQGTFHQVLEKDEKRCSTFKM